LLLYFSRFSMELWRWHRLHYIIWDNDQHLRRHPYRI